MTDRKTTYDCAVIGGGLAGLCIAIQLAGMGRSVVVFEKHRYPFHKVCGEYVSNESAGFLLRLGLQLDKWDLPQIRRLGISSEEGYMFSSPLDLGGFGISRYRLDAELLKLARGEGVEVLDHTKVLSVTNNNIETNRGKFRSSITVGAFGKASPRFAGWQSRQKNEDNYIAVKYHIRTAMQSDRIELHNFRKGYCGISRIEDDRYCLCYISHADNLKKSGSSIPRMEREVLFRNPHLKRIFAASEFLFEKPLTVSNLSFTQRSTSDRELIYVGDAAGCISPLTGNGMSMSGYSSLVLSGLIHKYLSGDLGRNELVESYTASWNTAFGARIRRGRHLQYLFGKRYLSDIVLRILNPLGKVKSKLIASTHGIPF